MPKFLYEAQYSGEGLSGLMADGAAKRLRDVKAAIKSVGGKLEAFYFCLGSNDAILIADMPDEATAAAAALMSGSTGVVSLQTTRLLTIAEAEHSIEVAKSARYRPPGGDA